VSTRYDYQKACIAYTCNFRGIQKFCYLDRTFAEDRVLIQTYLESVQYHKPDNADLQATAVTQQVELESSQANRRLTSPISNEIYYLSPSKVDILKGGGTFAMKIWQWKSSPEDLVNGVHVSAGQLLSQSFGDGFSFELLTLSGLRKKISAMSSSPLIHTFCSSKGVTFEDERRTLTDYLAFSDETDVKEAEKSQSISFVSITSSTNINSC
jgi:hypothetical protein